MNVANITINYIFFKWHEKHSCYHNKFKVENKQVIVKI